MDWMNRNNHISEEYSEKVSLPYELKQNGKTIISFPKLWSLSNSLLTLSKIKGYLSYFYMNFLYEKFINDNMVNSKVMEPTFKNPDFFKEIVQNPNYSHIYSLHPSSHSLPLHQEKYMGDNWEIKKDIILDTFPIYLNQKKEIEEYPLRENQKIKMREYFLKNPQMILLFVDKFKDISTFFSPVIPFSPHLIKVTGEKNVDIGILFFSPHLSHIYVILINLLKMCILQIKRKETPSLGISSLINVDPNFPLPPKFTREKENHLSTWQVENIFLIKKILHFLSKEGESDSFFQNAPYKKFVIKFLHFIFNGPEEARDDSHIREKDRKLWIWRGIFFLIEEYKKIHHFFFFSYLLYPRIIFAKRTLLCPYIRDRIFPNKNCFLCVKMVNGP